MLMPEEKSHRCKKSDFLLGAVLEEKKVAQVYRSMQQGLGKESGAGLQVKVNATGIGKRKWRRFTGQGQCNRDWEKESGASLQVNATGIGKKTVAQVYIR